LGICKHYSFRWEQVSQLFDSCEFTLKAPKTAQQGAQVWTNGRLCCTLSTSSGIEFTPVGLTIDRLAKFPDVRKNAIPNSLIRLPPGCQAVVKNTEIRKVQEAWTILFASFANIKKS